MLKVGTGFLVGRFLRFTLEQVPGAAGLPLLDLEQAIEQGFYLGIKLIGDACKMDVVDFFPSLNGQPIERRETW